MNTAATEPKHHSTRKPRRGKHRLASLGGLSLLEVLRRTARAAWDDDVFGQGGRMAFYQFLALFPSLLLFFRLSLLIPALHAGFQESLISLAQRLFPRGIEVLFLTALSDIEQHLRLGVRFFSLLATATWAAHNGTWAMIWGFNRAYEVREERSWVRLTVTIVALTFCLAVMAVFALGVMLLGMHLTARFHHSALAIRSVQWIVVLATLYGAFSLLYRFAPDVHDARWRWINPGSACGVLLWIVSALIARFYFDRTSSYETSYGHLASAVMLLLWLYVSNGAVLIGAEMNSEIEKAQDKHTKHP